jgi:endogenous inhibitor of DNA gyrase (YacG/DUF329 family)
MSTAVPESPCPHCGRLVPVTIPTSEPSDQLAADHTECPHCGAPLVRAIEGHADRGWSIAEQPGA